MIEACRLPFSFDAQSLRDDLTRLPESAWQTHYVPDSYRGSWRALSLRALGGHAHLIHASALPSGQFRDTRWLARCPRLRAAIAAIPGPKTNVRLMCLGAGAEILEHADTCLGYEDGRVRLHVPLQTDARVEFHLNGRPVVMAEGECWYLNANLPHRARNPGPADRVHLVLDCEVSGALADSFRTLGFGEEEERGAQPPDRPPPGAEEREGMIALLERRDDAASRRILRELSEGLDPKAHRD